MDIEILVPTFETTFLSILSEDYLRQEMSIPESDSGQRILKALIAGKPVNQDLVAQVNQLKYWHWYWCN
jgi:hypothetical protein